jgi:hypothetical protein
MRNLTAGGVVDHLPIQLPLFDFDTRATKDDNEMLPNVAMMGPDSREDLNGVRTGVLGVGI